MGRVVEGRHVTPPHPQILLFLWEFVSLSLSLFFHLNLSVKSSVAGASLIPIQPFNFPLEEKKKEQDRSKRLVESVMEYEGRSSVVSWPEAPRTSQVSLAGIAVWIQFAEAPLQ